MPIKLHCNYCGKKIEAPDNAGGKWGKCPGCHNKVYVPLPTAADDELKLTPVDEGELKRQRELLEETQRITRDILLEKNAAEAPAPGGSVPDVSEEALSEHIIKYLRQMANGQLDEAQRTADHIVPHRRKVMPILEHLAAGNPPEPELEDIPRQVLSGLIRNLRTRLS